MDEEIQFLFDPSFWTAVHNRQLQGQRHGQAVFNVAYADWPEVVNSLRSTSYDPFHHDDRVNAFLTVVAERLSNPA